MKKEIRTLLDGWENKIPRSLIIAMSAVTIGWFIEPAQAAVQVTRFDPPLRISAWSNVTSNDNVEILAVDFDADGAIDLRFTYGLGGIEAYFNAPTRIATRVQTFPGGPPSNNVVLHNAGLAGAVPLNSRIGTNIVSTGTNVFTWWSGQTNFGDSTQPLGDHQATVIDSIFVAPAWTGSYISFSTNGILATNIYPVIPFTVGDMENREGVLAVELDINGQPHYGYINFDFRPGVNGSFDGTGGVIYGWAYETEPGVAIKAIPLYTNRTRLRLPKARPIPDDPGTGLPITAAPQ